MSEEQLPKVVNAHWFGGSDKLPDNTKYIGRPSPYGNPYSSKSGHNTREECIALHRIDLYRSLIADPTKLILLKAELGGHDLACWCKHPKRVIGCHGDTFIHVFSDKYVHRDYTKQVINYLMEDMRDALAVLHTWILHKAPGEHFLFLDVRYGDLHIAIAHMLRMCKANDAPVSAMEFVLAKIIVDLELAVQDSDPVMIDYRMAHAEWVAIRFVKNPDLIGLEPSPPDIPLKRQRK